jgi:UDP-N-acetylmuramoyl-L-alanyl-D-glutamate--2,6-diaminopimelate ligase
VLLKELLRSVSGVRQVTGNQDVAISALQVDSRRVGEGGVLFAAVRGVAVDGHNFIENAIEKGASVIVSEVAVAQPKASVTYVEVADSALAIGQLAAAFNGHPSQQLELVAVTGTNGKTTVTTLLWQFFTTLGYKCGLIGTVENRIGEYVVPSTHTTPDVLQLQALLGEMRDAGCAYVFIETSSHAIHQQRIAGCVFAGAVFTNLTHDHLDYHGTFASYRDAKKMLFDQLPTTAFALTNIDDRNGQFMLQNTSARTRTYGLKKPASYKAKILDNALSGLHLRMDDEELHARLIGEFNAYNLLAVYGVARELGVEKSQALTVVSNLKGAEGRFDYITERGIVGIVDYAHTPDALEQVLNTILQLRKPGNRILVVVGCGGDRDRTKRPVMARIAAQLSDQAILTSDNPRTENPADILREMEAGLDGVLSEKALIIENREQAIKTAAKMAKLGDVVLVAGKGHEKYQEINGVKIDFDDKEILGKFLKT